MFNVIFMYELHKYVLIQAISYQRKQNNFNVSVEIKINAKT